MRVLIIASAIMAITVAQLNWNNQQPGGNTGRTRGPVGGGRKLGGGGGGAGNNWGGNNGGNAAGGGGNAARGGNAGGGGFGGGGLFGGGGGWMDYMLCEKTPSKFSDMFCSLGSPNSCPMGQWLKCSRYRMIPRCCAKNMQAQMILDANF